MYLKRLEISGFKSFADKTVMDFLVNVTAVIGPNGSGKSNIADAIRWVLGEQSVKILRAKKGEDIIFNGTPKRGRMNKASVSLILDNKNKYFPIDYEEVVISRKIFRDGQNQYFLNNNLSRLKDIHELLAKSGLGEIKYNIIGQGAADALLNASLKERRSILEEALGLKELEMKKSETERKLEATKNNINQARALVSEITPHLRFLEKQAKKASEKGELENKLKILQNIYFFRSFKDLADKKNKIEFGRRPISAVISGLLKEIEALDKELEEEEKIIFENKNSEYENLEKLKTDLQNKRQQIEREIGRLEGRIEAEKQMKMKFIFKPVDVDYIRKKLSEIAADISLPAVFPGEALISEIFKNISQKIKNLINEITEGKILNDGAAGEIDENNISLFENQKNNLKSDLDDLSVKFGEINEKLLKYNELFNSNRERLRNLERLSRNKRDEFQAAKDNLRNWDFEAEKLKLSEDELVREAEIDGIDIKNFNAVNFEGEFSQFFEISLFEAQRKIGRLKIEMEQVGAISEETLKEYEETKNRYDFLISQISDLESASASLYELLKTIEEKINNDFESGFDKINKEFDKYFKIIFSGGSAELVKVDALKRKKSEDDEESDAGGEDLSEEITEEPGIDVKVDLPRKKIRGLNMLSGGERTLASIALLFAIISVNPPPFIVLDEIDAALDESNSKRYGNILQELAGKTQFVIITHNRESMHQAGALYGVTMSEDGVSKLVSIKMEES